MFSHFLNTSFRHFRKEWLYTLINVIGLTLGLTLVFYIIIYVNKEYAWNTCHEHRFSSYRILTTNRNWTEPLSCYALGPVLQSDLPEVIAYSRVVGARTTLVMDNDRRMSIRSYGVDQGIFDIFTFNILRGNREELLKSKEDVVISKQLADAVFPNENPIGKEVHLTGSNLELNLNVTGVFENQPALSTFKPDALFSSEWMADYYGNLFQNPAFKTDFRTGFFENYYRLRDGVSEKDFQEKLDLIEQKYYDTKWELQLSAQKVADIYLHSGDLANARTATGDPKKIKIFGLVGILVLLIATFNYILLASARSSARFREIGLRKVIGATRKNVSTQVLGESVFTALLSFPLSIILVILLMPFVNRILHTSMTFQPAETPWILPGFLLVCLFVGVVSGLYLALFLSRLKPVEIFRNRGSLGSSKSIIYKVLVTIQILIFISMLTCSLLILKQVRYAENLDQGFDRENLVLVPVNMRAFPEYEAFAQEIRKFPSVVNAGVAMGGPPTEGRGVYQVSHFQNPDNKITVEGLDVGGNYLETMGFRLLSGRFFVEGAEMDMTKACVINQTAVRELGIEGDPIGQEIAGKPIIGVIEDFYIHSVKSAIAPLVINYGTKYCYEVAFRTQPDQHDLAIQQVESVWKKMAPEATFNARDFDDAVSEMYSTERNFAFTIMGFTALAIFIAMLGLFGLSLLLATRRTKEIGLRKIHGASVGQIILTINTTFVKYTIAALVLSVPVSFWIITSWLQNFIYKTPIGVFAFLIAGLVALLMVLITVSYHAWKSARMNSAMVIKYE